MPDPLDLTGNYREELLRREELARRSLLKNYRGAWRGLESSIGDTLGELKFSAEESAAIDGALGITDTDENGAKAQRTPSADKIGSVADLLLKKRDWKNLENKIDANYEAVADAAAEKTDADGSDLGDLAVQHAVQMLDRQLAGNKTINKEKLEELHRLVAANVQTAWLAKREKLQDTFRRAAAAAAERARSALRQEAMSAILQRARGSEIAGRVKLAIEEREKDPAADPALVRTLRSEYRIAATESYREGLRQTFQESDDVTHWRWTSARTAKTCPVCWAMDGKIFPVEVPLKSHPHCRCTMVPILGSVDGVNRVDSVNSENSANSASSVNSANSANSENSVNSENSGNQIFARLAPEVQQAILGAKAFEAYQQGEFDLTDLVGVQYNDRFGVMLYRQSVDKARENAAVQAVLPGAPKYNPENLIAANFNRPEDDLPFQMRSSQSPLSRQVSDVEPSSVFFRPDEETQTSSRSFLSNRMTNTATTTGIVEGFSGGDETSQQADAPTEAGGLRVNDSVNVSYKNGDSQESILRKAMKQFAESAGLSDDYVKFFVDRRVRKGARIRKRATSGQMTDVTYSDDEFKKDGAIYIYVIADDVKVALELLSEMTTNAIDTLLIKISDPGLKKQLRDNLILAATGTGDERTKAGQALLDLQLQNPDDQAKFAAAIQYLGDQKANAGNPVIQLLKNKADLEEFYNKTANFIGPVDLEAQRKQLAALQEKTIEAARLASGIDFTTGKPIPGKKVNPKEAAWLNRRAAQFLRDMGRLDEADERDQIARFYELNEQERRQVLNSVINKRDPFSFGAMPINKFEDSGNRTSVRPVMPAEQELRDYEATLPDEEGNPKKDLGESKIKYEYIIYRWKPANAKEQTAVYVRTYQRGVLELKSNVTEFQPVQNGFIDPRNGNFVNANSSKYFKGVNQTRLWKATQTTYVTDVALDEATFRKLTGITGKLSQQDQEMLSVQGNKPLNPTGVTRARGISAGIGVIQEINRWTPLLADLYYGTTAKKIRFHDKLRDAAYWSTRYPVPPHPDSLPKLREDLTRRLGNSPQAKEFIDQIMRIITEKSYAAFPSARP